MKLIEFNKSFPDELSCKKHFKAYRDQMGVVCKKCGSTDHYWKQDKWQYECKKCKFRTTLRSGTVMQSSKLPFQDWYIAMHLITSTKKSFSAKEIQRQLGRKRYQPVWEMLHKLRSVMGLRDGEYKIDGEVELDEGFFETVDVERTNKSGGKRGRGSEKQTKVMVMAESKKVDQLKKTKRPDKKVGFIKMKVVKNLKSETINKVVEENINEQSTVMTDAYPSYNNVKKVVKAHFPQVVEPKNAGKILPWVHIAIANSKRLLLDIYHRIDDDFLQNYLNEFCYKFNRRYMQDKLFDRLLVASVSYRWNQL
jgi:transposase-like protein